MVNSLLITSQSLHTLYHSNVCSQIFNIILLNAIYIVSSSGNVVFNEVKTFMKKQPEVMAIYMSVTTSLNTTIGVSGNHLIYTRKSSSDKFYPM